MLRPLQQHPHFAACLRAGGREVVETGDGSMLLRRFAGVRIGLISRGSSAMLNAPTPKRCLRIFNADYPMDAALGDHGFTRLRPPVEVAEWDIAKAGAGLRSGMRKTWRHALDHASVTGVKVAVTAMPADTNHWLLQAELAQSRRRGYRSLPLWLVLAWASLHPDDAVIIEARLRGACIAGMIFLRHGDVVTYHIAHGTEDSHRLDAHRLMLWRAVEHFAPRGVLRMDLGTLDRSAHEGLARFKTGTGAHVRKLGGSWITVPGLAWVKRRGLPAKEKAPLR